MSAFGSGTQAAPPAPAQIVFAGFWIRVVAYIIDGLILGAVNGVVFGAIGSGVPSNSMSIQMESGSVAFAGGLSVLIPAIYTIGFWIYAAATPGKMVFGMQVVRADTGGPISPGQAIGRFFATFISAFVFGLGFIWVGIDSRKQGWHDKLAGTVVIRRLSREPVTFHP